MMRAAIQTHYGTPDVLSIQSVTRPTVKPNDVLVQVMASPVTQGDRRLRASDFPAGLGWIVGRLMFGVLRPRAQTPGTMFAGKVVAVGAKVTRFAVGVDVFGSADNGAYAELLTVAEDSTIANMPTNMDYAEAATLPYGAYTALYFLRDIADVKPGDRVLIIGATGGVGRYAVQIAKHLCAEVTGVGRDPNLIRSLGAHHVIDYEREDFTQNGKQYDVIFDTSGTSSFAKTKRSLTEQGRFVTLFMTLGVLFHMLAGKLRKGRRAASAVALSKQQDIETLRDLAEAGVIRPVIDARFPLTRIVDAHAHLETARPHGEVVVTVSGDADPRLSGPEHRPGRTRSVEHVAEVHVGALRTDAFTDGVGDADRVA